MFAGCHNCAEMEVQFGGCEDGAGISGGGGWFRCVGGGKGGGYLYHTWPQFVRP